VKILCPAVTCVLVSHMKPQYLDVALRSAADEQTRRDIEIVVADSGQWIGVQSQEAADMAAQYARWSRHPLVTWVTTGERPGLRHRACPVAWSANQVIRAGLVRGRYMCTFYDDDRYLPRFFEGMAGYLDDHPEANAVMCSQAWYAIRRDGSVQEAGGIQAVGPRGPGEFDCQVDGGQVMWRTQMLDLIGDPWLPEQIDTCNHSDGIFLERLARVAGNVHAIREVLCENRKTPLSTYAPT